MTPQQGTPGPLGPPGQIPPLPQAPPPGQPNYLTPGDPAYSPELAQILARSHARNEKVLRASAKRRSKPHRAGAVGAVLFLGWFFVFPLGVFFHLVVPEIEHRANHAWTYQRVEYSDCTYDTSTRDGYTWNCTITSNPVSPMVAAGIRLHADSDSRREGPGYGFRWLHRTNGVIDRAAAKSPLWFSAILLLPVFIITTLLFSVRKAHRAGQRWSLTTNTLPRRRGRSDPGTPTSF